MSGKEVRHETPDGVVEGTRLSFIPIEEPWTILQLPSGDRLKVRHIIVEVVEISKVDGKDAEGYMIGAQKPIVVLD